LQPDFASRNVLVSPLAASSTQPPAMLVYLTGHVRTFFSISEQMVALLDATAGGSSYAVFMHTWDELDHGDSVWWRRKAEVTSATAHFKPPDIARSLSDSRLNAFWGTRRFVARVDSHPGSAAISERYNTTKLNRHCMQGIQCIDHAVAQLHELRLAHTLAEAHLRPRNAWPLDLGETDGNGGHTGSAARTPVVKSRPDVLLSEGWKSSAQLSRMRKAFASASAGGRVLGHTGPWKGGFGDIAWVIALDPLNRVLSQVDEKGLAPLLKDDSRNGFWAVKTLVRAKAERMYHAEQAWREVLVKSGFESFVTGWFAGLAKGRLVKFENGTVGVDRWHCYRQNSWTELQPWLQAHGLAKTYMPIALTLS